MSTNSFIGKQLKDGTIRAIYCHWDGYPQRVGRILNEDYSDTERIDLLLDLGGLSSLGSALEPTDDTTQKSVCVAYGRDRGESGMEATLHLNRAEFLAASRRSGVDYRYLYHDGKWETIMFGDSYSYHV